MSDDPTLHRLREQIAATDLAIVAAVNRRLVLVRQIKEHKAEQGLDFVDPQQEERLLAALERANGGPLSDDGLRELVRHLLDLSKRELGSSS